MFHDVIGPLLALMGTLLAGLIGYRQWRKQQDSTRTAGFVAHRDNAYTQLWQKLEAVHLSVRMDKFETGKFNQLLQAVNIYIIEQALYLDQDVKREVNDYMIALRNFGKLLEDASATGAKEEASATSEIAPEVLDRVKGLASALNVVNQQRNTLVAHFKKVLTAKAGV